MIIVARFVWVFPATYLPRWLSPPLARRDPSPPWQWPFVLSFTGVRGVVSLAAALAIPLTTASGAPFPDRDLILVITFGVIIVTLVGLGSALPAVIRWLGLAPRRRGGALARAGGGAEGALRDARRCGGAAQEIACRAQPAGGGRGAGLEPTTRTFAGNFRRGRLERAPPNDLLRLELIEAERKHLHRMLREGRITDKSRRRIERELDLEEAALVSRSASTSQ